MTAVPCLRRAVSSLLWGILSLLYASVPVRSVPRLLTRVSLSLPDVYKRQLIQLRKIGTEEVVSFEVSGGRMEVVEMIPGYTHNIVNLSDVYKRQVGYSWGGTILKI